MLGYLKGYQRPRKNNILCVFKEKINDEGNDHDSCGIIYSGGVYQNDFRESFLLQVSTEKNPEPL